MGVEEPVICLYGVYKIFGPDPEAALKEVKAGGSKKDLASTTNHVLALADVNLQVNRGEIFVVMGLSGSGKSTLVRCINRLVEPTAGQITIDGIELRILSKKELLQLRSQKLGMVFQNFALLHHRNVIDNVAFGLEVQGEARASRYEKARASLKLVGLEEWAYRMPVELSGGMQQRVGLARALALNPPILLMDEPFSGLDPLIRKQMQRELLDLQGRLRKTIVFITHDLDEALTLGDRIGILKDGRVEQQGSTPEEIVLSPASDYVRAFVQDVDLLKVLSAEKVMENNLPVFCLGEKCFHVEAFDMQMNSPIFIVDNKGRYLGALSLKDFQDALPRGSEAIRTKLPQEAPRLGPLDHVRNILEDLSKPPFAVAVVGEGDQFLGAITRESVFSKLGREKG